MILKPAVLAGLLSVVTQVLADVAPEVTTIAGGYNYIAKLPCIGCPYLYQDTSTGENGPWASRVDDNALLLNISLPFDAAHLSINNAPLLSDSRTLPRIYASQVISDYSRDDLSNAISTTSLDTVGPLLGLSYGYSLRRVTNSTALVFRFNVFEAHFSPSTHNPLLKTPVVVKLDNPKQRVVELILLPRPLLSAGDVGPAWEIVSVRLVNRDKKGSKRRMKTMVFGEWDEFGRKGSPTHLVSAYSNGVVTYASSGFWGLSVAILGFIVVFVLSVVGCVVGWDWWSGEYEKAQHGKGEVSECE
ncbi:uncharacterized protein EKO05_0007798 [Ascochyta rabiei]|uniref:uncharacterized protein n=1 Tax=Didymella rabiei TaxID=5454 RepID=UPI001900FD3A|nr:uncharacterized protein EKO05_0007798 [Ascochyta rabiei]UPX17445.1 hypothetical protein EKO05_0007798 [Ascochyta rabiei]